MPAPRRWGRPPGRAGQKRRGRPRTRRRRNQTAPDGLGRADPPRGCRRGLRGSPSGRAAPGEGARAPSSGRSGGGAGSAPRTGRNGRISSAPPTAAGNGCFPFRFPFPFSFPSRSPPSPVSPDPGASWRNKPASAAPPRPSPWPAALTSEPAGSGARQRPPPRARYWRSCGPALAVANAHVNHTAVRRVAPPPLLPRGLLGVVVSPGPWGLCGVVGVR